MQGNQIKIQTKPIWVHKSTQNTNFTESSVLSDDPWLFVELWLKRGKKHGALPYWIQARRFSEAASVMDIEAAPVALYYSFLNATKALLQGGNRKYSNTHGVNGERPEAAKAYLFNESVKFKKGGVLAALCAYFNDHIQVEQKHSLKALLWNLPFIHRAFLHTFKSSPELFIPIEEAHYVQKTDNRKAWFQAKIASRYSDKRGLQNLPAAFECFTDSESTFVRRKTRFEWIKGRVTKLEKVRAIERLSNYHKATRKYIVPISSTRDLWYVKKALSDNTLNDRHSLAIIFAAMHRLSELSRYDPEGLNRHLNGDANWLVSEFIQRAPSQFFDQIASEITGLQFWRPHSSS